MRPSFSVYGGVRTWQSQPTDAGEAGNGEGEGEREDKGEREGEGEREVSGLSPARPSAPVPARLRAAEERPGPSEDAQRPISICISREALKGPAARTTAGPQHSYRCRARGPVTGPFVCEPLQGRPECISSACLKAA